MGDPLYDLLIPHFDGDISKSSTAPTATVNDYLRRLTSLRLSSLVDLEPQSLAQTAHTNLLSLQSLASRNHKSVVEASKALSMVRDHVPNMTAAVEVLKNDLPSVQQSALDLVDKYKRTNSPNEVLDRRKNAMLLARNLDHVSEILELPKLLANAIAASSSIGGSNTSTTHITAESGGAVDYSQALDLFVHIKRLQMLHPESNLIRSIVVEAEEAMKDLSRHLIIALRAQTLRLPTAIRLIGWLGRVVPELAAPLTAPPYPSKFSAGEQERITQPITSPSEGGLGYLFLTCRLYNLLRMLDALAPLRNLADQETKQRLQQQSAIPQSRASAVASPKGTGSSSGRPPFTGHQTERYLKRYIEIFREQSFATISMFKNIFPQSSIDSKPSESLGGAGGIAATTVSNEQSMLDLPSSLATFSSHLVSLLTTTLQSYIPNLKDSSARDSFLMQVLYAAGSLGRLGADFSMAILPALFDDEDEKEERDDGEEDEGEDNVEEAHTRKVTESDGDQPMPDNDSEPSPVKPDPDFQVTEAQETQIENGNRISTSEENNEKSGFASSIPTRTKHKSNNHPKINHSDDILPEYIRLLQKHRLQASKLETLSASSSSSSPSK